VAPTVDVSCFLPDLTSDEWAAWVQAIGSIAAIVAAAWIAIYQSKQSQRSALELHHAELRAARVDIAKTIYVLANNSLKAMKVIARQLHDRESVHKCAEGLEPCDIGEIGRIDTYIAGLPIHSLPHSLVTLTMILGSTVRQCKGKVEMVLRVHRQMDGEMFADFFDTISRTVDDIQAAVTKLEA
jgi:Zn-dependent alcohol dehydrogenase